MSDLKICRVCLRTEAKIYSYDKFQLKYYYEEVVALKVNDTDNLPKYFCYECSMLLHKFHKFKEKCYIGKKTLKELLWKGALNYENIYKIDLKSRNLESQLEIVKIYNLEHSIKDISIKNESQNVDCKFESSEDLIDGVNDIITAYNDYTESKDSVIVNKEINSSQNSIKIIKEKLSSNDDKKIKETKKRKNSGKLNLKNWKKFILTEEQALQEFRSRALDKKYLAASHKCMECFRWFTKKEMLERHSRFRHSEFENRYECRFCKMKFKWKCDIRKHIQQHYIKYQCVRCDLVCMRENTVRLHEEYHSGVTRKCQHCGQEFRHMSTYYTHLRTHRSDFVCTSCGASFVSRAGLHQHRKVKHIIDYIDSPDDYEDVNTYCDKCKIMFDTRNAFEEHFFHSAMHTDGLKNGENLNDKSPMKVFSKSVKNKVIKKLRTRNEEDMFAPSPKNRRRKVRKRIRRKPTTCYQCGAHFDTQAACMKHHHEVHPRTSFFPPAERHICEICGASLAPGSVAVHLNIHTRQTLHTCDTCGRQFHSTAGLKRHLVTHTGEKRYSCAHCDKKFTQSNSMKLHYRTFHLKEPYPKRNRRKTKEPQKSLDTEETTSDEESDSSLPQPGIPAAVVPRPDLEPVPSEMLALDNNIQYMRL